MTRKSAYKLIKLEDLNLDSAPLYRGSAILEKAKVTVAEEDGKIVRPIYNGKPTNAAVELAKGDIVFEAGEGNTYRLDVIRSEEFPKRWEDDPENPGLYRSTTVIRAWRMTEPVKFRIKAIGRSAADGEPRTSLMHANAGDYIFHHVSMPYLVEWMEPKLFEEIYSLENPAAAKGSRPQPPLQKNLFG